MTNVTYIWDRIQLDTEEAAKKADAIERGNGNAHNRSMSDGEIDAKLEAAEARTDTKIARFEAKLDLSLQKLDHVAAEIRSSISALGNTQAELRTQARSNLQIILATIVGGLLAVFFGLFAILQWSDARMFGMIQLKESVKPAAVTSTNPGPAQKP